LKHKNTQAPLTPRRYAEPTTITKPDLQVEEVLFQSYLREKQRADRYLAEMLRLKADAKAKKAWARVQRLTKLKVSPSEKR
jgi:hypothetical protein